jgi:hypothetical protein
MYTFSLTSLTSCRSYPVASIRSRPKKKREQLFELEHTGIISRSTYRHFIQRYATGCCVAHSTSLGRIVPARGLTVGIVWVLDSPATGHGAIGTTSVPRDLAIANFACVLARYGLRVAKGDVTAVVAEDSCKSEAAVLSKAVCNTSGGTVHASVFVEVSVQRTRLREDSVRCRVALRPRVCTIKIFIAD